MYDEDGVLTRAGEIARFAALAVGVLSALALVPAGCVRLLSPMACGGGCSRVEEVAGMVAFTTPILLMMSMLAGLAAFRAPTGKLLLLTFAPPAPVVAAFYILPL